jgi:BioD-like phosphotransacetylase family protein
MGPVCYDGFPTAWISAEGREAVLKKIQSSFDRVAVNRELMVIEGTGNAAAGAAFGLSNAFMAKQLDAKVVLVASGGVGQPTDEIFLNKNFFDKAGVEVVGAIVNKAYPHEFERIDQWMRRALDGMGIRLLGVIPYEDDLARATMLNLFERFRGKILNGEAAMGQPLGKVVLGAMSATSALQQLAGHITLICPCDREDVLISALSAMYLSGRKDFALASIVITGTGKLSAVALQMIRRTSIPVLHVEPDAYAVVAEVHAANFKILPEDTAKIQRAIDIVRERVDLDLLLQCLS